MDQINFKGLSVLCEHWTFLVVVVYLNGNSKTDISSRLTSLHFLHVLYFFNTVLNWTVISPLYTPIPFQATMLKKRKHKVKRRNTEPHMQLSLSGGQPASPAPQPCSAPHNKNTPNTPLVDLCHSPTHATPVWCRKTNLENKTMSQCHNFLTFVLHNQNPLFNG